MNTILVVDDEPSIRQMIALSLAQDDTFVATAASGAEALDIARSRPIDLLITDMRMPGMDGLDLLLAVRRLLPALPAIIITGFAVEGRVAEALRLGNASLLAKPFEISALESAIQERIGRPPEMLK